jgi:murein endopeptidase
VLRPRRAWGTKRTVKTLERVLADFHERFPNGPTVYVHDLSARWGGRIHPHKSHRLGRDVDIRVICKNNSGRRCRFSARHNWYLLQELIATGEIQYIFTDYHTQRKLYRFARKLGVSNATLGELFQYPRSRRVREGIVRHEPRHHNHFHVRFRRPDHPPTLLVIASL